MNRRSLLLSGGAALAAAGAYAGYTNLTGRPVPGQTLITPGAAHAQTEDAAAVDTSRVEELVLGNPDAEVTIMEFASYTCPHCASFHATVWPQLKEEYIDTGRVRFEYREVYFDAYGLWAALVARCGGQMRYFGISDILYDEQQQWARGSDANEVADNLRRIGRRAGLTDEALNECLADRDMATAMMQVYQEGMEEYEITGTPSFVINGTTYSNMSMDEFRAILDPLLADG
ncbi:DsbA family protein [Rhodobacter sp. NTK016B]|uniref:DsbA family protein n=1 Tax=Rhodobacter sp. NTK016B TaxID=2759676 RepID=UPI001A8DB439|nr:DsbA family protein [Rhodobacter sp. NTK016B]MBN8291938.1 DsbA family protein [Rhodobacter sp. NTK016B]